MPLDFDPSSQAHCPVLLEETRDWLQAERGGGYWDATFGCGGHAQVILDSLPNCTDDGYLVASDRDPKAECFAAPFRDRANFSFVNAKFSEFGDRYPLVCPQAVQSGFKGILMDLGVSSPQLDRAERGFSFRFEGPLDMRMDPTRGETAASWINRVDETTLVQALRCYGEEPSARKIAKAIIKKRETKPLQCTWELAELIRTNVPRSRNNKKDPATRTFQAIRMVINQEVQELYAGLETAARLLNPGGRMVVLTFQGLEVRILRDFLRSHRAYVLCKAEPLRLCLVSRRTPQTQELASNPRSRSAAFWGLELRRP